VSAVLTSQSERKASFKNSEENDGLSHFGNSSPVANMYRRSLKYTIYGENLNSLLGYF